MTKLFLIAAFVAVMVSASINKALAVDESMADKKQIVDGLEKSVGIAQQIAEDVAKATATVAKVSSIASRIGAGFQYIGPAFALISVFLPSQEDIIIEQLKEGFKQMHERFDQVDQELKEVKDQILITSSYEPYRKIQDSLDTLWSSYDTYKRHPKNTVYLEDMSTSCTLKKPKDKLLLIHKYVVEKGMGMDLLLAMLKDSGYANGKLTDLFRTVIQDATKAAFLRQACLGLLPGDNKETMKLDADEAGRQIEAIYNALDDKKEEYQTRLYKPEMLKDVNDTLNSNRNDLATYIINTLPKLLSDKYTFAYWTVVVYDTGYFCSGAMHFMHPAQSGTNHLMVGAGRNKVFITWSNENDFQTLRNLKVRTNQVLARLNINNPDVTATAAEIYKAAKTAKSVLVISPQNCVFGRAGMHTLFGQYNSMIIAVNF